MPKYTVSGMAEYDGVKVVIERDRLKIAMADKMLAEGLWRLHEHIDWIGEDRLEVMRIQITTNDEEGEGG